MVEVIAAVTAVALVLIALLHLYWGFGGRWPARDDASLNALVVGSPPGARMPGALACTAVALALAAVAAAALLGSPVAALGAVVFAARGLGGYVEHRFRPHVETLPYARWNRRVYSPLCLALAAGLTVSAAA